MRKFALFPAIVFIASSLILGACKKGDNNTDTDPNGQGIVGNWELASYRQKTVAYSTPQQIKDTTLNYGHGLSSILTFREDNTYKQTTFGNIQDSGVYQILPGKITLNSALSSDPADTADLNISGDVMTISYFDSTASQPPFTSLTVYTCNRQ